MLTDVRSSGRLDVLQEAHELGVRVQRHEGGIVEQEIVREGLVTPAAATAMCDAGGSRVLPAFSGRGSDKAGANSLAADNAPATRQRLRVDCH